MANTYAKLYIHLVFAVKNRTTIIPKIHRFSVQKIIATVIEKGKHELIEMYCMPNHIHILLLLKPYQNLDELVANIKEISKHFIQAQPWMPFAFDWQNGFGAFSCSPSLVGVLTAYIQNQEAHHKKYTFQEEYLEMVKQLDIPLEEYYVFDF